MRTYMRNGTLTGIVLMCLLVGPSALLAQQYAVQFPGNCFVPADESSDWTKDASGYLSSNTSDIYFYCPANFFINGLFVKGLSIDYTDSSSTGFVTVRLKRRHFPSGTVQTVGEFSSSLSGMPGQAKAHVSSIPGTKSIDNVYFTYWLEIYFSEGSGSLKIHAVRIQFGL